MTKKTDNIKKSLGKIDIGKKGAATPPPIKLGEEGEAALPNAKLIRMDRIFENPDQPRKSFSMDKLSELAESIKERGVLQPIRVRKLESGYQIIAGERRFRAAKVAGLTEIQAIVCEQSEQDAYIDSLIENIHREDLNPIDRAEALAQLRLNLGSVPWIELGAKIGLTERHIMYLIGLKVLPDYVQEDIKVKVLTEKHGRALRKLLNKPELFNQLYERIKAEKLSGDQALAIAQGMKNKDLKVKKEINSIAKKSNEILSIFSLMNLPDVTKEGKEQILNNLSDVLKKAKELFQGSKSEKQ